MSDAQMHYIWNYETNSGVCWCGEDHADESGNHGPIPDDQWQPCTPELLDSLYLDAWLGHECEVADDE